MKLFLCFIAFSSLLLAQDPYRLSEEELNPETQDVLIRQPEKYLRHESIIYDFNTDLGLRDQRRYTGTDKNKASFSGHLSSDYEHFNELMGLEFNYMRRTTRYDQIWYGFQLFNHRTYFDAVTSNRRPLAGDDSNSESQFQRPGQTRASVLAGGLGVGYRFKLLLDFFHTENVFETIEVFGNYVSFTETFVNRRYQGWGLTTNYGMHRRTNTSYFYGGKLSYNLAQVTREAIADESTSERSLALGWLSLALELGIFF
jgi:hypothetical protein